MAQRRAYTHWRATPRHARFRGPIAVFGDAGLGRRVSDAPGDRERG